MRTFKIVEEWTVSLALLTMAVLPILEILGRRFLGVGVPGSGPIVQHLTLWVGFLGAALAARDGKLLALATGTFIPEGRARQIAGIFSAAVAAAVATVLAWGSIDLIRAERETGTIIGAGIPAWVAQLVLPVGFGLIAARLVWRASPLWSGTSSRDGRPRRGPRPGRNANAPRGSQPLACPHTRHHCGRTGCTHFRDSWRGSGVAVHERRHHAGSNLDRNVLALSVSPTLPAIPLFTLAGFILAEGQSSERLLRVFRALFGWIPGGTAVVCAVVCSFFTVFTGGSGVTILALGGVLLPALLKDGYRERFSLGLLTASGSLGLLLPPSLPLILYGVVAQIPIEDLFIGGILPGILLTTMIAAWGVREGIADRRWTSSVQHQHGVAGSLGGQVGTGDASGGARRNVQRAWQPLSRPQPDRLLRPALPNTSMHRDLSIRR